MHRLDKGDASCFFVVGLEKSDALLQTLDIVQAGKPRRGSDLNDMAAWLRWAAFGSARPLPIIDLAQRR